MRQDMFIKIYQIEIYLLEFKTHTKVMMKNQNKAKITYHQKVKKTNKKNHPKVKLIFKSKFEKGKKYHLQK